MRPLQFKGDTLNKSVTLIFHNFRNELLLQKAGSYWVFPTTSLQENEKLTEAACRLAHEGIGATLLSNELKFVHFLTNNNLINYFFYCASCKSLPSQAVGDFKFFKIAKIPRLEIDIQHKQILPLIKRYTHE